MDTRSGTEKLRSEVHGKVREAIQQSVARILVRDDGSLTLEWAKLGTRRKRRAGKPIKCCRTGEVGDVPELACQAALYLKRSSKACRPDLGAADCVSRSTVVRGFQSVQSLRASFTAILAAIGCRHCSRAPGSKNAHCVHGWSSAPHLPQRALLTSALASSPAQRAQRLTSLHFIRFGARGPSG